MTQARKYTARTAAFYALALPLNLYFNRNFHTGPCGPNLDILISLLVFLTAIFGFLISLIARLRGKRAFTGPAIINGIVLLSLLIW